MPEHLKNFSFSYDNDREKKHDNLPVRINYLDSTCVKMLRLRKFIVFQGLDCAFEMCVMIESKIYLIPPFANIINFLFKNDLLK